MHKEGEGPTFRKIPISPARPDTGAVYISDCETLDDPEAGSWYPSTVKLDTKSKSEGKASVTNNLSAEQALRENSFRFVPVSPLDLTGGKELQLRYVRQRSRPAGPAYLLGGSRAAAPAAPTITSSGRSRISAP